MRVIPKAEDEGQALTRFKTKFTLPTRPSDSPPDLPNDLDDMDDRDLMNVYTEFMAWVSYLKGQLVQAEIEEDREGNQCRVTEAKVLYHQLMWIGK